MKSAGERLILAPKNFMPQIITPTAVRCIPSLRPEEEDDDKEEKGEDNELPRISQPIKTLRMLDEQEDDEDDDEFSKKKHTKNTFIHFDDDQDTQLLRNTKSAPCHITRAATYANGNSKDAIGESVDTILEEDVQHPAAVSPIEKEIKITEGTSSEIEVEEEEDVEETFESPRVEIPAPIEVDEYVDVEEVDHKTRRRTRERRRGKKENSLNRIGNDGTIQTRTDDKTCGNKGTAQQNMSSSNSQNTGNRRQQKRNDYASQWQSSQGMQQQFQDFDNYTYQRNIESNGDTTNASRGGNGKGYNMQGEETMPDCFVSDASHCYVPTPVRNYNQNDSRQSNDVSNNNSRQQRKNISASGSGQNPPRPPTQGRMFGKQNSGDKRGGLGHRNSGNEGNLTHSQNQMHAQQYTNLSDPIPAAYGMFNPLVNQLYNNGSMMQNGNGIQNNNNSLYPTYLSSDVIQQHNNLQNMVANKTSNNIYAQNNMNNGAPVAKDGSRPWDRPMGNKFLCTFLIGIPGNDPFNVPRRIIGRGGENMRFISEQCQRSMESDPTMEPGQDSNTKIRLRGKDSGFKERDTNLEAPVPLQVNVSTSSRKAYETAKDEMSNLLRSIYAEYERTHNTRYTVKLYEHPQNPSPGIRG